MDFERVRSAMESASTSAGRAARADDFLIVVSGDPRRSNAYAFASNGMHGYPTSRVVRFG